jgi:hypothetical protein
VLFQSSSYPFFPTPNCFKISFLCSWWLCFKHLWGRWTAHCFKISSKMFQNKLQIVSKKFNLFKSYSSEIL